MWRSWIDWRKTGMEWKYYNPEFECDKFNRNMLRYSPWSGHRLFAYDLVANIKPKTIVELGSFYGCSTFAFAQAVKDFCLDTVIWGVDLWAPFDEFTLSDYKENVYGAFRNVRDNCFEDRYVKMLRMPFDQALERFQPKSIDLLHIDGSHYYEDVKHDFTAWREKLSDNAIVLFHDIATEKMNNEIMGSHCFWEEIKKNEKYTLQFDFSFGLGVLFLSRRTYREVVKKIDLDRYTVASESEAVQAKDEIRKMSFRIQDNEKYIKDLMEQIKQKEIHLNSYKANNEQMQEDYERTLAGKEQYIQELESQLKIKDYHLDQYKRNIEKLKADYEKTISEKDNYINQLKCAAQEEPPDGE